MKSNQEKRINEEQNQEHTERMPKIKRVVVILVAIAALAAICIVTAIAFGDDVFNDLVVGGAPKNIEERFESVAEHGDYVNIRQNVGDAERFLETSGYLVGLTERDGKFTVSDIYTTNGQAILLIPENTNGFTLQEGEEINLYINMTASSEHSPGNGTGVTIGLVADGMLYETHSGKVNVNGETVVITAPSDGEFKVCVKNASSDAQNYKELSVTLGKR